MQRMFKIFMVLLGVHLPSALEAQVHVGLGNGSMQVENIPWGQSAIDFEQQGQRFVLLNGIYGRLGVDAGAFWGIPLASHSAWHIHTLPAPTASHVVLTSRKKIVDVVRYPVAWLEQEEKLVILTGMVRLKVKDATRLEELKTSFGLKTHKFFGREGLALLEAPLDVNLVWLLERLGQEQGVVWAALDLLHEFAVPN